MSTGRTVAFCPQCEQKFAPGRGVCPDDGAQLFEYEMVEESGRDRLTGTILDERFRIEAPLSRGGMGTVYRGRQLGVERDVAIKVLEGEAANDESQVQRFLREARTLSKLKNPNIVNFIDFGRDPEHRVLFLVMELIEGVELASLLGDARLEPNFAVEIVAQMAAALAEPHQQDVVHRDLKPANVMLQSRLDGRLQVKLVDFGIADALHGKTRLTETGAACGTPHYMAPEQIEGERVVPSVDIYGLGAILYRLLTGRPVFDDESDVQILFKHVRQPAPTLAEASVGAEMPGALVELVGDLLAKSPDARPESVLALRERLLDIREARPDWGELRVDSERPTEEAVAEWVVPVGNSADGRETGVTEEQFAPPETGEMVSPPEDRGHETSRVKVERGSGAAGEEGERKTEPADILQGETVREEPALDTVPVDSVDGASRDDGAVVPERASGDDGGSDAAAGPADRRGEVGDSASWQIGIAGGAAGSVLLVAVVLWAWWPADADENVGASAGVVPPSDAGQTNAATRREGTSNTDGASDVAPNGESRDVSAEVGSPDAERSPAPHVEREERSTGDDARARGRSGRAGERSPGSATGAERGGAARSNGAGGSDEDVGFAPMPVGGDDSTESSGGAERDEAQ